MNQSILKDSCKRILLFSLAMLMLLSSCKKFLDGKPNQSVHIPSTMRDAQMLLDFYGFFNQNYKNDGVCSDDDFRVVSYASFLAMPENTRNNYIWRQGLTVNEDQLNSWIPQYRRILYANVALDALNMAVPKSSGDRIEWNAIKGTALFFRGLSHYQIAEYYAPPYNKIGASVQLGIPLKFTSDINEPIVRASMEKSWKAIVSDLEEAIEKLPGRSGFITRPDKASGFAQLARVWLAMGEYSLALGAADSCLHRHSDLLDFNTLDSSANLPMPSFSNKEMILHTMTVGSTLASQIRWRVDSILYASYADNDLRKSIYFRNNGDGYVFKGDMGSRGAESSGARFNGLTTGETLLIKAECLARLGQKDAALDVLNTLLLYRWKKGTFQPKTAIDSHAALDTILLERRKELIMRSIRWFDLRRLNHEPRYARTIQRWLNGILYELPPNDNRYTFLIPQDVIQLSGIPQNPI